MFSSKANPVFPGVEWTGESTIHVSLALEWKAPKYLNNAESVFQYLYQNNHAGQLYNFLKTKFSAFEWLIEDAEFSALFYVDVYRQLYGKPPTKTKEMIQNPATGNIFHVIGRIGEFVGGIRYWTRPEYSYDDDGDEPVESTVIGFRFRITTTKEDEDETRERIRERCEEAMTEMELIYEGMEIKEIKVSEEPEKIKELAVATLYN